MGLVLLGNQTSPQLGLRVLEPYADTTTIDRYELNVGVFKGFTNLVTGAFPEFVTPLKSHNCLRRDLRRLCEINNAPT